MILIMKTLLWKKLLCAAKNWQDLFDWRVTSKVGNTVTLPADWTSAISKSLSVSLPYCCIHFRRHKLYKNDNKLFKCWYYCTNNKAVLYSSLTIFFLENSHTVLKHVKGEPKSFKSRNVKGDGRKALAKEVAEMPFSSKVYNRRLAALDETSFQMGNLKNVSQPKDVISQCKY